MMSKRLWKNIKAERGTWTRIADRKPVPFKLVTIRHLTDKRQRGWWTGHGWDGLNPINPDTIVEWQPLDHILRREARES